MVEMVRPGPVRWLFYAYGGRLPARYREWVLHDVTTRTWRLRHFVRTTVQLAPIAVLLYVFVPGEPWMRALAVLGGLLIGYFYSFAYMEFSTEHRAVKAGYPRGTATKARMRDDPEARRAAQERYEQRWR
ncbi:hypothetical protein SAMN05443637_12499 [Pseudonocardia thermophila]|jgi:hypothetical protein|uniref:DUF5313 domain-containing protein n=1 Tax=Pseudonocardia thermophila TaxID=1848 RepID=A0A1M6ZPS2_PSETH|nr:DUF5313 family protein [Pseudonocardia thermophila]SHL32457.1 hypothetical protein SAMN05443637_12499 [Pseudonocardia thermophila]